MTNQENVKKKKAQKKEKTESVPAAIFLPFLLVLQQQPAGFLLIDGWAKFKIIWAIKKKKKAVQAQIGSLAAWWI